MRAVAAAFAVLFLLTPSASAQNAALKPPQWYLDDIQRLTADGGRWIADNSDYKSESEPFEAYGTEWVSGFDGDTVTGRLFGIKDGKELTFNFWEFRQYWHPGRNEAIVEQFGWGGALGVGVLDEDDARNGFRTDILQSGRLDHSHRSQERVHGQHDIHDGKLRYCG